MEAQAGGIWKLELVGYGSSSLSKSARRHLPPSTADMEARAAGIWKVELMGYGRLS